MAEDRLRKLARSIDGLEAKDEELLRRAREIEAMRRKGAVELYGLCSEFVQSVNKLVSKVRLDLGPPDFSEENFRDPGANLFQINAKGRVVLLEFRATDTLTSTEHFRVPYALEGSVRWYNQDLLDRVDIQEHGLFFCINRRETAWRYFDGRTQRSGQVDRDYLIGVLETLL